MTDDDVDLSGMAEKESERDEEEKIQNFFWTDHTTERCVVHHKPHRVCLSGYSSLSTRSSTTYLCSHHLVTCPTLPSSWRLHSAASPPECTDCTARTTDALSRLDRLSLQDLCRGLSSCISTGCSTRHLAASVPNHSHQTASRSTSA